MNAKHYILSWIFSIVFLFAAGSENTYSNPLNTEIELSKEIDDLVSSFILRVSPLPNYSEDKFVTEQWAILELFEDNNCPHYNDYSFIGERNTMPVSPIVWLYLLELQKVVSEFKYEFEPLRTDLSSDPIFAYAEIRKYTTYRGVRHSQVLVLKIRKKTIKINMVTNHGDSEFCEDKLKQAQVYFDSNEFAKAMQNFKHSDGCDEKKALQAQIDECQRKLEDHNAFKEYVRRGDQYFQNGSFQNALQYYNYASQYDFERPETEAKINRCQAEISYQNRLAEAEAKMKSGRSQEAGSLLSELQQSRPQDNRVRTLLEKSRRIDPQKVQRDIKRAVDLWNLGKLYESFKYLYVNRNSGQLNKVHNYMLGLLLMENRANIRKKWNKEFGELLSEEEMRSSGAIYLFKSASAGYHNAQMKVCQFKKSTFSKLNLHFNCEHLYNR